MVVHIANIAEFLYPILYVMVNGVRLPVWFYGSMVLCVFFFLWFLDTYVGFMTPCFHAFNISKSSRIPYFHCSKWFHIGSWFRCPLHISILCRFHNFIFAGYLGSKFLWYHDFMFPFPVLLQIDFILPWFHYSKLPYCTVVSWFNVPWFHNSILPWTHDSFFPYLGFMVTWYPGHTSPWNTTGIFMFL